MLTHNCIIQGLTLGQIKLILWTDLLTIAVLPHHFFFSLEMIHFLNFIVLSVSVENFFFFCITDWMHVDTFKCVVYVCLYWFDFLLCCTLYPCQIPFGCKIWTAPLLWKYISTGSAQINTTTISLSLTQKSVHCSLNSLGWGTSPKIRPIHHSATCTCHE